MKRIGALWLALACAAAGSVLGAPPDQLRKEFLKVAAPARAAGEKPDGAAEVRVLESSPEFIRERVLITTEPGVRAAMLILRPSDSPVRRRPAVIVLHGTRGRKEGMESWLRDLVARGFVACSTDARWHGELARVPYEEAIIQSYRTGKGHPWLYDTVADTLRVVDYLQARADIDPARIGMLGISMGGMNTWLTAAVDPRVKVAVPCIGVTSFSYQLETGQFAPRTATLPEFHNAVAQSLGEPAVNARVVREAWNKLLPGILDRFDCPEMLPLIAPRPLLILNGEKDDRCPIEGVRRCYAAAEAAYRQQNASDRLKLIVAPGVGHAVTDEQKLAALDWFQRWLAKPEGEGGTAPRSRKRNPQL